MDDACALRERQAMETEHCKCDDSEKPFLRSMSKPGKPKYATPKQEWDIVVAPEPGKE